MPAYHPFCTLKKTEIKIVYTPRQPKGFFVAWNLAWAEVQEGSSCCCFQSHLGRLGEFGHSSVFAFFRAHGPHQAGSHSRSSQWRHLRLGGGGERSAETRPAGGCGLKRGREEPSRGPLLEPGAPFPPGLISFSIRTWPLLARRMGLSLDPLAQHPPCCLSETSKKIKRGLGHYGK